jgi:hypothetical protein
MADAQACTAETTFIAKGNRLKLNNLCSFLLRFSQINLVFVRFDFGMLYRHHVMNVFPVCSDTTIVGSQRQSLNFSSGVF